MKFFILSSAIFLAGCASTNQEYAIYAETVRSINRDNTMAEIACYQQADDKAKTRCQKDPVKLESPKRNWLSF